jgi:hypothetical protein
MENENMDICHGRHDYGNVLIIHSNLGNLRI